MDAARLEFLCQVGIAVFSVATIACGYGAYYFGGKSSAESTSGQTAEILHGVNENAESIKQESRRSNEDIQESLKSIHEAVRELKNATVSGSPGLVEALGEREEWDFSQGTFEFLMLEKALLENEPLLLNVVSRNRERLLRIELDSNNFLRAIFKSPEIGTITRGVRIGIDEINRSAALGPAVYVAFTWNLKEASTTLYVNGKPRDEM